MKFRDEAVQTTVTAIGVAALVLGVLAVRLTDGLLVSGIVPFVTVGGLGLLLRGFFSTWALERYAANPGYRAVVAQHFHRVRRASFVMLGLAITLAVIAFAANSPTAAVGAGMVAGSLALGLTIKSAFNVEVVNP